MSGTRQYRQLQPKRGYASAAYHGDELTPKQIAERTGVSRQKVYEYRKKLKDRRKTAPLTDMATLVIHQRVVFRPDTTIENPEDVNGPSFIDPDSGFDCSRCGQSMSVTGSPSRATVSNLISGICPGCAGVATPYRDDTINPSGKETTQ